jgi:hypothetical protein
VDGFVEVDFPVCPKIFNGISHKTSNANIFGEMGKQLLSDGNVNILGG